MTGFFLFLHVCAKWVDVPALAPKGGKARLKTRKALQRALQSLVSEWWARTDSNRGPDD